jgi:hypothetical protein
VGSNQYAQRGAAASGPAVDLVAQLAGIADSSQMGLPTDRKTNDIWDLPWVRPVTMGQDNYNVHISDTGPFGTEPAAPCCPGGRFVQSDQCLR